MFMTGCFALILATRASSFSVSFRQAYLQKAHEAGADCPERRVGRLSSYWPLWLPSFSTSQRPSGGLGGFRVTGPVAPCGDNVVVLDSDVLPLRYAELAAARLNLEPLLKYLHAKSTPSLDDNRISRNLTDISLCIKNMFVGDA